MKTASVSTAKNQLSVLIKEVQRGDPVIITDRGVPVAQLVPVGVGASVPPRAAGLARQGLARLPEETPGTDWLALPWPDFPTKRGAVAVLLEERRSFCHRP